MRTEKDLRPYQVHAIEHAYANPYAGLFLDMGLGKTVSALTVVNKLMYDDFAISKVFIIAPKRVAETVWHTEAQEWEHLKHLTFSLVLGDERKRKEALKAKADIYVINRENVGWLQAQLGGAKLCDMLIIDELSSFKSNQSQRFKALRLMRPAIDRVVGLTGTPMPNDLLDLWSQLYLLDMGERLGKTITGYRDKHFNPGKRNGHVVYNYVVKSDKNDDIMGPDIEQRIIFNKISDICISMKTEDYLSLPERMEQIVWLDMPPALQKAYEEFEETAVLAMVEGLDEGAEITAVNAAGLTNKLLQFANGAIYREDKSYYEVHTLKLDALAEDIEALDGEPMLLFYSFKSDVDRICKHLKAFKPYVLDPKHTLRDVEKWNKKEIPFMLAHPASAGHGLNLQKGGRYVGWFGRPWSLELLQQGRKRIHRSGQMHTVFDRTYAVRGTMDETVIQSNDKKEKGQDFLLDAVKAIVKKHTHK